MDVIISTLATFWLLLALFFVLIKKGLWIFNDVAKGLSMFMLEKALGPAIDFVSGRPGSSSSTWIIHGLIWAFAASTFTFIGLWLSHDASALHSFESWGYHPRLLRADLCREANCSFRCYRDVGSWGLPLLTS